MGRAARRAAVVAAAAALFAGCGSSGSSTAHRATAPSVVSAAPTVASTTSVPATTTTIPPVRKVFAPGTFDATDALLAERVRAAGLSGGIVRIVDFDGDVVHEHAVGGVSGTTPLSVGSSTKWLTAATFMTFVDRGAIGLDDNIARWLPEFAANTPPITPRQLLDHTSGVHDNPCQDGGALAACVRTLAVSSREFPAGTAFSYGNAPFLVVGRLIEELGGADFATVVHDRLTGPLGMDDITWPGAPAAANGAFGVRVTVDDYGKFLAVILHDGVAHDGVVNSTRVLSSDAVRQIVSDQVGAYDTSHDYSVGITKIPRYGLGCWPDVTDASGRTLVVSGNGGKGLYPWVDFATRTWGIVGVQDERGAQVAVPASQVVEVEARTAVAR
jgi:CubicO group peptidase (beta-lactamase class C family)